MSSPGWPTTISFGALTCLAMPASTDELLRLVDDLMYSIKRAGKNAAH